MFHAELLGILMIHPGITIKLKAKYRFHVTTNYAGQPWWHYW